MKNVVAAMNPVMTLRTIKATFEKLEVDTVGRECGMLDLMTFEIVGNIFRCCDEFLRVNLMILRVFDDFLIVFNNF